VSDQSLPTGAELRHEMREELKRLREVNADLLAALEDIVSAVSTGETMGEICQANDFSAARAAIAKARGS
jgi:hypothetical protein